VIVVARFGRNHARVYQQLEQQRRSGPVAGSGGRDVARADAVAQESGCPLLWIASTACDHAQRSAGRFRHCADGFTTSKPHER